VAKLVYVQLETNHANTDSVAWYAYFVGAPSEEELANCLDYEDVRESAPLGAEPCEDPEEVPNLLSKHTGLRRFFVANAC